MKLLPIILLIPSPLVPYILVSSVYSGNFNF